MSHKVGNALLKEGVRFISFRNEQAASYAASAYGYLTGKPGVLLVVGGPGLVHALAGVFNSNANRWPLVVLAGSSAFDDVNKGGFQELDQVSFVKGYTKSSSRPLNYEQLVQFLNQSYKLSFFGKPGSTYLDLPATIIEGELASTTEEKLLTQVTPLNHSNALKFKPDNHQVYKAAKLLKNAQNPLIIIGKGAAYADASRQVRKFVTKHHFAFLPTPMGKGVVPDDSKLNVSSARSQALKSADVVLLLGARLNWILHFGEEPRFKEGVKFIQVDNYPEEFAEHANTSQLDYGLVGDIGLVIDELDHYLTGHKANKISLELNDIIHKNNEKLLEKELLKHEQLTYNNVYKTLREYFEPHEKILVLVSEGANTMDIARISFPQNFPRQRLDAGTNATMGVGIGYAIAARAADPEKYVVAIEGDSAFGFSGLEIETAVRSQLPIIVVVMNNSGVYHGNRDPIGGQLPSTALGQETRYDLMAQGLGADAFLVRTDEELKKAIDKAFKNTKNNVTTLLNVIIEPGAKKKVGFGWQNKKAFKL